MSNAEELFRSLGFPAELAETAGEGATTPLSNNPLTFVETGEDALLTVRNVPSGRYLKRVGDDVVGADPAVFLGIVTEITNTDDSIDATVAHTDIDVAAPRAIDLGESENNGFVKTIKTVNGTAAATLTGLFKNGANNRSTIVMSGANAWVHLIWDGTDNNRWIVRAFGGCTFS